MAYIAQSQELPTIAASGFSFSLGTKFTIKLYPVDSVNYEYSIIAFEAFQDIVDTKNKEALFEKKGEDNTIEFYFCYGTSGTTEQEREENMRILLIMKNYTDQVLDYISEIQREEDGEYEETSNVGTFPNAITTEIWPYMIYHIGLRDFRKYSVDETIVIETISEPDNIRSMAHNGSIFIKRFNIILSDLGSLKLNDISKKELEWGAIDNTPTYNLGIDESYYPNPNKYEIDTAKVFLYKNKLIENSIDYYASKERDLVRAVLIEWKEAFLIDAKLQEQSDELFKKSISFLEEQFAKLAGKHTHFENEENYTNKTYKTSNGFTIKLQNLKTFNRIRVLIYKD